MEIVVLILVVAACLCFLVEALPNIAVARWNLVALGLLFTIVAVLLSDTVFRTGIS